MRSLHHPESRFKARFHPDLEPIMRCRKGTQLGLIQGLPLAAGAYHREDRVGAGTIRYARPSSATAMGIHVDGYQRIKHRPEFIRDPPSSSRLVIGRARSLSRLVIS